MVEIEKMSDLSIEEAEKIKDYETIVVFNESTQTKSKIYSVKKFIQTKKAIDEFYDFMPEIPLDAPDREMQIFCYTYVKLAHMVKYDNYASEACSFTGYYRDMTEDLLDEAACAYGALINNKALCSGFSDTLKVLLETQGIKCKEISGYNSKRAGHAWNQVCIDGKWYNCDLTNDYEFILEGLDAPYFLKSNVDFKRYEKYNVERTDLIENSVSSVSSVEQENLVYRAEQILKQENMAKQEIAKREEQERVRQEKLDKIKKWPKFMQTIYLMATKEQEGVVKC